MKVARGMDGTRGPVHWKFTLRDGGNAGRIDMCSRALRSCVVSIAPCSIRPHVLPRPGTAVNVGAAMDRWEHGKRAVAGERGTGINLS